jgi:hypothetical protein
MNYQLLVPALYANLRDCKTAGRNKWTSGKKYLDMTKYLQWQKSKNRPVIETMLRISDKT